MRRSRPKYQGFDDYCAEQPCQPGGGPINVYLVVQHRSGSELLRRVLPSARGAAVKVAPSATGTSESGLLRARSLLTDTTEPVILLLDARTVDEEAISELRGDTEFLLYSVGTRARAKLVYAVPELEVVLFHDPAVLERVLGMEVPERARIEARFIPKQVLAELVAASGRFADASELVAALGDDDARRLAEHPLIRQLEGLIADMQAEPVPAELRLRRAG